MFFLRCYGILFPQNSIGPQENRAAQCERGEINLKQLTPKQNQIYEYILLYAQERGYPPSVREIAAAVNLKSPSTVHFHLKAMEAAGAITRGAGKTRSITPVMSPQISRAQQIPILGDVAAGEPILAQERIEDYLLFDAGRPGDTFFALRIRGDSMINAGILNGDLVVVRQQGVAENGEIVIALLEDEATCKRLHWEGRRLWLLPENPDYQPIDGTQAIILGKVTAVVRRYE